MNKGFKVSIETEDESVYLCVTNDKTYIKKCLCGVGDNINMRAVFEKGTIIDIYSSGHIGKDNKYIMKIEHKGLNTFEEFGVLYFMSKPKWVDIYDLESEDVIKYRA